MKSSVLALTLLLAGATSALAQTTSLTSVNQLYTQNFDTLATAGASNAWANDSTLDGWSLFNSTGAAITTYAAGTGTSTTGAFYSFGSSSSDRALGGLGSGGTYFGSPASGVVAGYIALGLTNNTGSSLTGATIDFSGEQWRNGGNTSAQTMVFEYGFGATFGSVGSWTQAGGNFDWSSVVNSSTAAAVDGNVAGLAGSDFGGTITFSAPWLVGESLWLRWIERNDTGNDHGLAIDDVSVSVIPEPSTYAALVGIFAMGFAARRRRSAV